MNSVMKLKYGVILLLTFFMCASFGQQDRNDQIKALKKQHIGTALDLTATEAQKFWNVYNTYEDRQYDIRHNKIRPVTQKLEEKGGIENLSPRQALVYVLMLESAEEELFNLRKKLITDLRGIIGPIKILKLKKAEEDFNKLLLQKYKGKKD